MSCKINYNGDAEFGSGYFRGDITGASGTFTGTLVAAGGTVGGFDIGSDYIRDTNNSMGLASTVNLILLENRIKAFNPRVKFCRTSVEHFGLKGLNAHYTNFTEEQYQEAINSL